MLGRRVIEPDRYVVDRLLDRFAVGRGCMNHRVGRWSDSQGSNKRVVNDARRRAGINERPSDLQVRECSLRSREQQSARFADADRRWKQRALWFDVKRQVGQWNANVRVK